MEQETFKVTIDKDGELQQHKIKGFTEHDVLEQVSRNNLGSVNCISQITNNNKFAMKIESTGVYQVVYFVVVLFN